MSSKERRKSDKSSSGIVTLTVPPEKLRAILKTTGPKKDTTSNNNTPASSTTPLPSNEDIIDAATAPSSPDNKTLLHVASANDSMPSTPSGNHGTIAAGSFNGADTPGGTPMAPPHAGDSPLKKKGVKRSAAAAGVDGPGSAGPASVNGDTPAPAPRVRSKPGPKKKAKLDDSMVEIKGGAGGVHKLGPKASMGAINAGLRALDRSGKPCRKWVKRGFQLKSFTGVAWAIPRWKAPPKQAPEASPSGDEPLSATASADGKAKQAHGAGAASGDATAGSTVLGAIGAIGASDDVEMSNAPTPAAATPIAA